MTAISPSYETWMPVATGLTIGISGGIIASAAHLIFQCWRDRREERAVAESPYTPLSVLAPHQEAYTGKASYHAACDGYAAAFTSALTSTLPGRASDAGPTIPDSWVPCQNCGYYGEPDASGDGQPSGPRCQGAVPDLCLTRLCANCEEGFRCVLCGLPFCVDHARPNIDAGGCICQNCEGIPDGSKETK